MSSPSDIADLYKFEDVIDSGVKAILSAGGIANVYKQADGDQLVTPRVEVQFSLGEAVEHYSGPDSEGRMRFDTWNGTLRTDILTDRNQNAALHSGIRAKVRALLYDFTLFADDDLFPYHSIQRCMEISSAPGILADEDLDLTAISWRIVFAIRPDAWPA